MKITQNLIWIVIWTIAFGIGLLGIIKALLIHDAFLLGEGLYILWGLLFFEYLFKVDELEKRISKLEIKA